MLSYPSTILLSNFLCRFVANDLKAYKYEKNNDITDGGADGQRTNGSSGTAA